MRWGLLAASACMDVLACASVSELDEGLILTVNTELPRAEAGVIAVESDLGYTVRLSRAYLVSSSVEIFPCPVAAWRRLLLGRALAHAAGSPTRLGTAFVEPLTGSGGSRALGEIRPPPGRYCRAAYTASAADRDAIGMPADGVAAGNTVYLEGTFRRGGGPETPFTVASPQPFAVAADLVTPDLFGATSRPTLVVHKQADHWFDAVDFEHASPRLVAVTVVDNIRRSIRLGAP